jgi:hypothetical protein
VYGVSLRVVVSKKSWCQKNRGVKNRGVMKYPLGHEIPDPKKPQKIPDPRARARRDIPFWNIPFPLATTFLNLPLLDTSPLPLRTG